jgi:hypothetical protein
MNYLAKALFFLDEVEEARKLVAEALPCALKGLGPSKLVQSLILTARLIGLFLPPEAQV